MKNIEQIYLALIVFFGFIFRLVTVTVLDYQPESDYAAYQSMAVNLLNGQGIVDTMGNFAMYNVGYPLFVLTPVFAVFSNSIYAAQIANTVLGAASILLCYYVAKEAGAGRTGRLLAAAFWALYLPSWIYAEYLAKENLMIPVMLGVVYCALRFLSLKSYLIPIICGGLFGVLALTGNAALSLVLPVFVALMIIPTNFNKRLSILVLVLMISVAICAPWMIRNHQVLGSYVMNTNGGFNLYLGNNPSATGLFVSIVDTPMGQNWQTIRKQQGEVQSSETLKHEALLWIKNQPDKFAALAIKKLMLFWTPPIHEGKGPASSFETLARQIWVLQFFILVFGAIGSLFLSELRTKKAMILWLALISYTSVHMLFYVIYRYREPIMPILCIIFALVVEALLARKKKHVDTQ